MKMFFHNIFNAVLIIVQLMLCMSCNERMSTPHNTIGAKTINNDTLYDFDVNKKSIAQPFDPMIMKERYKFVQVEVTKVINPKKHPVTFEVHYEMINNEKIFLGSFSLYPSDNPGKFIVPTQGKLKNSGYIILSLIIPGEVKPNDTLKVTTKKIELIKG